jgi:hypothetical protein
MAERSRANWRHAPGTPLPAVRPLPGARERRLIERAKLKRMCSVAHVAQQIKRPMPQFRISRFVPLLLAACVAMAACGRPEDPARVALRERLRQKPQLSAEELARVRGEVSRAIEGRRVRIKAAEGAHEMDQEQRGVVLGMLTDPVGMFDEGPREEAGRMFRVLNAPGDSPNAEIEASRKLWIDLDTFQPSRFEFVYGIAGYGDYAFDLTVE